MAITYYKKTSKYDGDTTKNASLTGAEVDENFATLENRDVKEVKLSKDNSKIQIILYNGDMVEFDNPASDSINKLDFKYDDEHGILYMYRNGEKTPFAEVGDFVTEAQVKAFLANTNVFSDESLEGNGSSVAPLRVANAYKSGMIRPIDKVLGEDEELPTSDMAVGDRYVTSEKVDTYGALYNYKGVGNIIENIEATNWRVPTKGDWDDLLNALEPHIQDREHQLKVCNRFLGNSANEYMQKPEYKFNVEFCGYAYEEEDKHVVYNDLRTAWWTASNEHGYNAYMKRIDRSKDEETGRYINTPSGVYQDIVDGENFYSVRLVRDYEPNEVLGLETIMGKAYPTTLMPSLKKGLRVWTAVNFSSDMVEKWGEKIETTTEYDPCTRSYTEKKTVTPVLIDDYAGCKYVPEEGVWPEAQEFLFVNEWDGEKWVRTQLNEYITFYLKSEEGYYFVKKDEDGDYVLVDAFQPLKDKMDEQGEMIDKLIERIEYLEKMHGCHNDKIEAQLNKAVDAEPWAPYTGKFEIVDDFVVRYSQEEPVVEAEIMYDFGKFLGCIHSNMDAETVTFNGKDYKWYHEGLNDGTQTKVLKGSNYSEDGTTAKSLVKALVVYYNQDPKPADAKFTIEGVDITIKG